MAEEYISSIIGSGAEKEIDSAISKLDELAKKIVETNNALNSVTQNSASGSGSGVKAKAAALTELEKIQNKLEQTQNRLLALEDEDAKKLAAETLKLRERNRELAEEAKLNSNNQRVIDQLARSRAREEAEIAKQNNAYEQLKLEYTEAANAAKKLGAEYFNMQRSGTGTTEQLKQMAAAFKDASANALGLHKGLFDIEQSVGQSQRNVGNYNALMFETNQLLREAPNFALSARTGFMALSNNLPMFAEQFSNVARSVDDATGEVRGWRGALREVGKSIFSWQTLLIVGITLLIQYGDRIGGVTEAMKEQEERQKALNDAYESGRNQAGAQVATLKELNGTMTNTNLSMSKRLEAYNKAVDLYPSYLKQISKEDALNGGLADTINNKLIPAIMNAAKARGLENKLTKLYEQELDLRDKLSASTVAESKAIAKNDILWSEHGKTLQKVWDVTKGIATAGTVSSAATVSDAQLETKKYRDAIIETKVAQEQVSQQLQEQLKLTGELDTSGNDRAAKNKEKAKHITDTTNAELKAMDELAAARAAFNKQQIETDAATQKAIFDDEKENMQIRLDAYSKYVQDKIALYELESGVELSQIEGKLAKIEQIEAKSADKRTKQEQRLLEQKQVLQLKEQTLIDAHNLHVQELQQDATKARLSIIKSSDQRIIKELGQSMDGIQQYYQNIAEAQIKALSDALLKGEINVKEYNDKVKEIQRNAQKETLDNQITAIQNYLKTSQLDADTRAAIEKDLTDKKKKLYETDVANYKDSVAKKESLEKAWRDTAFGIEQDLINIVSTISNNNAQAEIDALDQQKTALEEKNKTEIDGINSSMMSQEEKDAATEAANARLAAQEKALDNEKKQRQKQLAQAQKEQAMMNIILNTAEAVIKAYTDGDPYTRIPRAIAAAAAGAAELAIAAAAPLPQYATGTDDHPGGLAVVGEKGRELINLPSGQSFVTPNIATVMDLPKHTEVIPHKELLDRAHLMALNKVNMINQPVTPNDYSQALIGAFEQNLRKLDKLENTIKNKQEIHFFWKNGELMKSIKNGSGKTILVNRMR